MKTMNIVDSLKMFNDFKDISNEYDKLKDKEYMCKLTKGLFASISLLGVGVLFVATSVIPPICIALASALGFTITSVKHKKIKQQLNDLKDDSRWRKAR